MHMKNIYIYIYMTRHERDRTPLVEVVAEAFSLVISNEDVMPSMLDSDVNEPEPEKVCWLTTTSSPSDVRAQ